MCGGFVGDILDGVGDLVEGVVDVVEDIGSSIDDMVHDIIPGGWAGVGALALLSIGIADPTLLGLAEEGALTSEALASAGIDAAAVATDVAAISPEVLAATEAATASGVAPEIIAMANATADPIAALVAAQGSAVVDTAYLASIGAPEALIATATANNAALVAADAAAAETAAGTVAEGGATTGATEGAATGATEGAATGAETGAAAGGAETGSTTQIFDDGSTLTTAADGTVTSTPATDGAVAGGGGSTTQVFDDGSTLTTNADGTVSATDINGNPTQTLVSPGGPGQAPVFDATGTAVPGAGAGTPDPTLLGSLGNLGSAVVDSLGPLGTAALLGGGAALLGGGLTGGGTATGPSGGTASYEWGQATPLVSPGLNPGYIGMAASQPFYQTTSPTQAQYYWGAHNPVNMPGDLDKYNAVAGAPTTPWGMANSAVGGTAQLNVPNFVNQYVTNPAWAGVNAGTTPGYTPPPISAVAPQAPAVPTVQPTVQPAVMPTVQPAVMPQLSLAEQAAAARTTGPAVPVMVP